MIFPPIILPGWYGVYSIDVFSRLAVPLAKPAATAKDQDEFFSGLSLG